MKNLKGFLAVALFGSLALFNSSGYAEESSDKPMTQQEIDQQQKKEDLKKEKMKKLERQMNVVDRVGKASAANSIAGVSKSLPTVTPTVRPVTSGGASSGLAASKVASASRRY